jgi:DNA modification methylase
MLETNKIIQGNCIDEMGKLPESTIDLICSSPPYNVGIDYDTHDDRMSMEEYWGWTEQWLTQAYRLAATIRVVLAVQAQTLFFRLDHLQPVHFTSILKC